MKDKNPILFTVIMFLIGFMLAVQFTTTSEKPKKESKENIWKLRDEISEEQDIQMQLIEEIEQNNRTIRQYEKDSDDEKRKTLEKTLLSLEKEVGLKEVSGSGLVIYIEPFLSGNKKTVPKASADLLSLLINELNKSGIKHMAINDERVTATTSIRDVNKRVYMNNKPLAPLPIVIQVIAEEPEKLYNELSYSLIMDQFVLEDLLLQMEIKETITLPDSKFQTKGSYLEEVVEENKGAKK